MWWTATFEPMWTVSLLPDHATPWERVFEGIDGDLVARDPVALIAAARRPFDSPATLLPYLAIERSVDEFSSAWSETRRRTVVAGAFDYHRVKGTRPAMARALAPLGFDVTVREWFEAGRPPYTFALRVRLGVEPWLSSDRETLIRVANGAKNAHTKLESIEPERRVSGTTYFGGIVRRIRSLRVGHIPRLDEIRMSGLVYNAAIIVTRRTLRVGPRT